MFSCEHCTGNLKCFYEEPEMEIPFPEFTEEGTDLGVKVRTFTKEQFWEEVVSLSYRFARLSNIWEFLNHYFQPLKHLCLGPFLDMEWSRIVVWKFDCDEYQCLPYKGGYLDQPAKLMEAFRIISSTKAMYYQEQDKNMRLKFNKRV